MQLLIGNELFCFNFNTGNENLLAELLMFIYGVWLLAFFYEESDIFSFFWFYYVDCWGSLIVLVPNGSRAEDNLKSMLRLLGKSIFYSSNYIVLKFLIGTYFTAKAARRDGLAFYSGKCYREKCYWIVKSFMPPAPCMSV